MSRYTCILITGFLLTVTLLSPVGAENTRVTPLPSIQAPLAKDSLLLDIVSISDRRIAVGSRGHILVSENGKSWQQSRVPVRSMLTAIHFHDSNRGWAVGHDAVILGTRDGGKTWQLLHFAPELEAPFLDVWFSDDKNGIAIGAYGLYFSTNDGGKTWTDSGLVVEKKLQDDAGPDEAGDFAEFYELHLNSIAESSDGTLYIAAEAGRIYRSDNRGRTWVELPSPYVGSFFGVLTLRDDSVMVFGLRGHLYRSVDRGRSWRAIETPVNEMLTNAIQLADGRVVIIGLGGTVLVSKDGKDFTVKETGTRTGYSALVQNNGVLTLVGEKGIESFKMANAGK